LKGLRHRYSSWAKGLSTKAVLWQAIGQRITIVMWAKKQGEWIILAVLRMDVFFGLFFGARARTQSSGAAPILLGKFFPKSCEHISC